MDEDYPEDYYWHREIDHPIWILTATRHSKGQFTIGIHIGFETLIKRHAYLLISLWTHQFAIGVKM